MNLLRKILLVSIVAVILAMALGISIGIELRPEVTSTSILLQTSYQIKTVPSTVSVIVFQNPNSTITITRQIVVESINWEGGCTVNQNTTTMTKYFLPSSYPTSKFYATVTDAETSYFGTTIVTTTLTPIITIENGTTLFIAC